LWGALAIAVSFAVVSALFVLPAKSTWGERCVVGLVGVAAAYSVLLGFGIGWHMWSYRHSDHEDDSWVGAASVAGNGAQFMLMRRRDAMPYPLTMHGKLKCVVRGPAGFRAYTDPEVHRRGEAEAFVQVGGAPGDYSGAYEIRWYGTRRRGKWPYEIARQSPTLAHRD
jgi:hypothetical protein